MPRYTVIDNGKTARFPEHPVHENWKFAWFNSFKSAKRYADRWLHIYGPFPHSKPGKFDYSGYGDILEIKRIK